MNADQIADAQFLHDHEMGAESATDRSWYRWIDAAEALARTLVGFRHGTGYSARVSPLDGDEPSGDTFSLDAAYEAWERGISPHAYVWRAYARMPKPVQPYVEVEDRA